jgi:hypothetical protein
MLFFIFLSFCFFLLFSSLRLSGGGLHAEVWCRERRDVDRSPAEPAGLRDPGFFFFFFFLSFVLTYSAEEGFTK